MLLPFFLFKNITQKVYFDIAWGYAGPCISDIQRSCIFKVFMNQNKVERESNSFLGVNIHEIHSYILLPDITGCLPGTALGWGNIAERNQALWSSRKS